MKNGGQEEKYGMKKEREWRLTILALYIIFLSLVYFTPKPGPIVLGRLISGGEAGGIELGGNTSYSNSIVPGGLLVRS